MRSPLQHRPIKGMHSNTMTPQNLHATRLDWVDTARGLAIILVVFGHSWRGIAQAGLLGNDALFQQVDSFIYLFHMNVFFVLAGFFLPRQILSHTTLSLVKHKLVRLIYPMVLWTYIFIGLRFLAGPRSNTALGTADLAVLPLPPVAHMWFLWALFLGSIGIAAIIKLFPLTSRFHGFWYLFCGLCGLAWILIDLPDPFPPYVLDAMRYLPFLALGVALGMARQGMPAPTRFALLTLVVFVVLGNLANHFPAKTTVQILGSATMTIAFLHLCRWLDENHNLARWSGALRYIGQMTMAIFLAHTIFSAATRIALMTTGNVNPALHLALGCVLGIAGPIFLHRLAERLQMRRLLGF